MINEDNILVPILFPGDQLYWSLFFRMALQDGQDVMRASCTAWDHMRGEEDSQRSGCDPYLDVIRPAVGALACHDLGGLL